MLSAYDNTKYFLPFNLNNTYKGTDYYNPHFTT